MKTKMGLFKPKKPGESSTQGTMLTRRLVLQWGMRRGAFQCGLINPSTWEAAVGVLGVQGQPGRQGKSLYHTIEQRMKQRA